MRVAVVLISLCLGTNICSVSAVGEAAPVTRVDNGTMVCVVAAPLLARMFPILMLLALQCAPIAVSMTAFDSHVAWTPRCV